MSVLAWAILSTLGIYWGLLHPYSASTNIAGSGDRMYANWVKNRTLHCGITAPGFLIAGILFLLSDARLVHIKPVTVWPFVFLGIAIAFLLKMEIREAFIVKVSVAARASSDPNR